MNLSRDDKVLLVVRAAIYIAVLAILLVLLVGDRIQSIDANLLLTKYFGEFLASGIALGLFYGLLFLLFKSLPDLVQIKIRSYLAFATLSSIILVANGVTVFAVRNFLHQIQAVEVPGPAIETLVSSLFVICAVGSLNFSRFLLEPAKKPVEKLYLDTRQFKYLLTEVSKRIKSKEYESIVAFLGALEVRQAASFVFWLIVNRPKDASDLLEVIESDVTYRQKLAPLRFYLNSWLSDYQAEQDGSDFKFPLNYGRSIQRLENRADFRLKRVIDILLSIFSLVLLSLTLILPITIAFLWIYHGNLPDIFFISRRIGRGGVQFYTYKFRCYKNKKGSVEQRISKIGSFLLLSGLDRIPAFLSVLKGEMSLVGPRSLYASQIGLSEDIKYQSTKEFRRRFFVKPGLIDPAGIDGIKATGLQTFSESLETDSEYVETWLRGRGLLADVKIFIDAIYYWFREFVPLAMKSLFAKWPS